MSNEQGVVVSGVGVPNQVPEAGGTIQPRASAPEDVVEALRRVTAFVDLPDEQLRWFAAHAVEKRLEPGELLFRKGDPPDWMSVFLEGETHARRSENSLDDYVYIARAGDPNTEVTGKLPFSRMTEYGATGRAVLPTRLLLFPVSLFPELIARMPLLVERLVWKMSDRVRETTRADEQRDKLMALGKLSAGLAHELNNPAAAARRAANELLEALEDLRAADLSLCRHHLTGEQRAAIAALEREAVARVTAPATASSSALGALEQSDREDELQSWLEARGVGEAWKIAPALVEAGLEGTQLDGLIGGVEAGALADVLARIAAQLSVAKLVGDIRLSAGRISELVGAIKEYSYMDRAPVEDVDLHRGLENTLLILKHKLKEKSIEVVRDYAPDLPKITAHGGELNQMWTNLIDNAVDAMAAGGRLRLRTKREPESVLVEIRDNGPGIPPDVQPHIFEPFFTTKGVGEGTGLGLDTVGRIVRKHHGHIRFETRPGDTCFQVRLPLTPETTSGGKA